MRRRKQPEKERLASADDLSAVPEPPPDAKPLVVCPICSSPRIKQAAKPETITIHCECEGCGAAFVISSAREFEV